MVNIEKELRAAEQLLNEFDYKGAISKFNKVLKEDPNNPRAYFGKAEAAIGQPKLSIEEVSALYKRAIELDPKNAFYYARFGAFCLDSGMFEEAETYYNKAAELDPDNAKFYYQEFGFEYYNSALTRLDEDASNEQVDEISRKALQYIFKSMDLTMDDVIRLLR
jgi:tetratricopeptide (TPR) repeat protein